MPSPAELRALESLAAQPSPREIANAEALERLEARAGKLDAASRRLDALRPADAAGLERQGKLARAMATRKQALGQEIALRRRWAVASDEERPGLERQLQEHRSRSAAAFSRSEVGDPRQLCFEQETAALALQDPGFRAALASFDIQGDEAFRRKVVADLRAIWDTPNGKGLLQSIAASGKQVTIRPGARNQTAYANPEAKSPPLLPTDPVGTSSTISYNADRESWGPKPWQTRPPAIGLAHELVHAEQAAYGRQNLDSADNDDRRIPALPEKREQQSVHELEAVGVPPHSYRFSENTIRAQWKKPQPQRPYYDGGE